MAGDLVFPIHNPRQVQPLPHTGNTVLSVKGNHGDVVYAPMSSVVDVLVEPEKDKGGTITLRATTEDGVKLAIGLVGFESFLVGDGQGVEVNTPLGNLDEGAELLIVVQVGGAQVHALDFFQGAGVLAPTKPPASSTTPEEPPAEEPGDGMGWGVVVVGAVVLGGLGLALAFSRGKKK